MSINSFEYNQQQRRSTIGEEAIDLWIPLLQKELMTMRYN